MEYHGSAVSPLTHTLKLEIKEGNAYLVDENEQLPYELLRNLGHGHSGNVEEVKDINTGRVFARKIIRVPRGRYGKDKKKIFDNEVKIICSLTGHHHIIQVFATYVSKFEVGLILYPVADEGDLERFLESFSQSLPDYESLDISDIDKAKVDILKRSFGCLASGLEFIHQRRIRHKDIKPRNILIHQGSVIYTDFGYSLDSNLEGHSTTTGRPDFLTRRYSAPEVINFAPRNSRSDVFSLGCVFLDILSTLTKVLDIDLEKCYYERISSIHTQMSSSTIPTSLEFLVKIIILMTLATPVERSTAAEVAGKLQGYPGFLCDRCQPLQITELPLRRAEEMIEPGDSNNSLQDPIPVIRTEIISGEGVEEGNDHNLKIRSNIDLAEEPGDPRGLQFSEVQNREGIYNHALAGNLTANGLQENSQEINFVNPRSKFTPLAIVQNGHEPTVQRSSSLEWKMPDRQRASTFNRASGSTIPSRVSSTRSSSITSSVASSPIDIEKADALDINPKQVGAVWFEATPLLPPIPGFDDVPAQSPLQSPIFATQSPFATPIGTPQVRACPTLSLSSKPSVSSFKTSQPGHLVPWSDVPPIMLTDPNDKWANKLGHANFTIQPEPYVPQMCDAASLRQLFADWEQARYNFTKHQVQMGEHYGVTSKTYLLTEQKWAEIDALWKANHDIAISCAAAIGVKPEPTSPLEPARLSKMPIPNNLKSESKFPVLGGESIVGPVVKIAPQAQRKPPRNRAFFKFFSDIKFPGSFLERSPAGGRSR